MDIISRQEAISQNRKRYFTGMPCKHGHIAERQVKSMSCCECRLIAQRANKAYYIRYYEIHKDSLLAYKAAWKINNKDQVLAKQHAYHQAIYKNRRRHLLAINPAEKLKKQLRNRLLYALSGRQKKSSTITYLGASIDVIRAHIERQFKPGMTWKNWGLRTWHIDHIEPLSWFNLNDEEERKRAFHYTNLQPLWATENLKKRDRYSTSPSVKTRRSFD